MLVSRTVGYKMMTEQQKGQLQGLTPDNRAAYEGM